MKNIWEELNVGENNMNNEVNWMQQGWECPKCGAVMSPTTSCCINCRGNNSFQSSLNSQAKCDECEDLLTAQQILNKTIEYELRKLGDPISPLGGDK